MVLPCESLGVIFSGAAKPRAEIVVLARFSRLCARVVSFTEEQLGRPRVEIQKLENKSFSIRALGLEYLNVDLFARTSCGLSI